MTVTMAVIVPSRGRPMNVAGLIEAWSETRNDGAELHIVIDDDDPKISDYSAIFFSRKMPRWVSVWVGPRRRLGGSLNHLAPHLAQHVAVVGFMGDDHRPRTPGWDVSMYVASGSGSVVYGNDLVQGEALPTAVFLDAAIIRALGYMVPPGAVHLYLDDFWRLLGEKLGTLRYLPDVVIEHVHPITGKAEWDAGYEEVNQPSLYDRDRLVFEAWQHTRMATDIAKIRLALGQQ